MTLPLKHAAFAIVTLAALALPAHAEAQSRRLLGTPAVISRVERRESGSAERLLVPVMGVRPEQLRDTYTQSRSQGRTHHAIDIHAPRGTPVLAVADGRVRKLHAGDRGGFSVYLLDDDGVTRYYYAHLDGYAEGLREGQRVQRGEVIGFVGDTGNAQPGDYHLHFSVAILDDPAQWWEGRNLNPYDLLARD
jgi:murein DD-endopeptidase MepM/ murein hydrolase activator NlpD